MLTKMLSMFEADNVVGQTCEVMFTVDKLVITIAQTFIKLMRVSILDFHDENVRSSRFLGPRGPLRTPSSVRSFARPSAPNL